VAALALATITPGLVPSFASAAQLTERSIELSTSAKAATGVSYSVTFTPAANADLFVLDFCSNSPLINTDCTAPGGFSVASAASADATVTGVDANTTKLTTSLTASTPKTVVLTNVTNPTASGPLYARILSYTTANASAYSDATTLGSYVDNGSAAISITDNIDVSGAVLESMTFCIAGPTLDGNGDPTPTTIGGNCTGTLPAPTLRLGKKTGDVVALDNEVSTGSLYGQISTNAASGAIVNLKSNAAGCGGLLRDGSGAGSPTNCDIAPALKTGIADGEAKFGAKINPTDAAALIGLNDYNASTFVLNYASNQTSGVTSTYGDPFFSTNSKPVSNQNLEVIFGAATAPNTPAGNYSAQLSLIATGKF
jgi:hypothetical protein